VNGVKLTSWILMVASGMSFVSNRFDYGQELKRERFVSSGSCKKEIIKKAVINVLSARHCHWIPLEGLTGMMLANECLVVNQSATNQ
jgi:hypothetical protein